LTVLGVPRSGMLITPPRTGWPKVLVERSQGESRDVPSVIDDDRAVLELVGGGQAFLDRKRRTARYVTPEPLSDDDLVHPFLTVTGGIFARWLERKAFHAGAFVFGGRAWAVLGDKEAGKSTLLAHLHLSGHGVLTDDVLVLDGPNALAGPRCIDLRQPSLAYLGTDADTVAARSSTRQRLILTPIAAEVPFGGWIFLEWGPKLEMKLIPPAERPGRLQVQRMLRPWNDDPVSVLDATPRPAWELTRPRRWDDLPRAADRLLETLPI
jgi:hypothetical protein